MSTTAEELYKASLVITSSREELEENLGHQVRVGNTAIAVPHEVGWLDSNGDVPPGLVVKNYKIYVWERQFVKPQSE